MEPASIRYKNPGAMWGKGNEVAKKWGSTGWIMLSDGKGQGNNIAIFSNYVDGICAQLDLWRTSPRYRNKPFTDAIAVWSGHNEVESYIRFVLARVPGMTRNTLMNDAFWRSPMGIAFLKAQAGHEAGKEYPAPAEDWIEAQRRVFSGTAPKPSTSTPKTAGAVVAGGAAAGAAHQSGLGIWWVIAIGIAVAASAFIIWKLKK